MHIAIAGNIGSGKTTLTKMLAKHYDWKPLFEPVDYNPYLEDFYQDMSRWSFNLQIYFLNKRFKDVVSIGRTDDAIIQDRTIFEDAKIFAPNLHRMGMMSDRDFDNYTDLFELMMSLVELPDLMIYIRSSIPNLVSQIEKRGRDFEKTMRIDYLQGLNELYEGWISNYKGRLLIIEGDTLKFESDRAAFRQITDRIDSELFGLFPNE
ncbi:deoxynucleoside kinase [Alloprevotella sp. oral taxon 473]|uniref:deoxynucleoside kinase n=1 Tax=Alloprevotella sp. oral taxon 473 TaxID=712469 RepID=UPI0002A295F8|nr:deoxynucleoside kinase [Alloprevotella sp. oral taxon 473]EKX88316.1 deoxynucleoside kinase [Alloprevotella sp. oral taxon 473 str. F0040]